VKGGLQQSKSAASFRYVVPLFASMHCPEMSWCLHSQHPRKSKTNPVNPSNVNSISEVWLLVPAAGGALVPLSRGVLRSASPVAAS